MKKEKTVILLAGLVIGITASLLVMFGNPSNMGFCIACFLRDTAGALGLHSNEGTMYIRPEIIGIVLGSFLISLGTKEFKPKGGSSGITRFVLGFLIMIGCLMSLGCPFRMAIRLAGGDINALIAIIGFALGIATGTVFLNHGYSLKKNHASTLTDGLALPVMQVLMLAALIAAPGFILFSSPDAGPGGKHAFIAISLTAGLVVGILAQRTRLCMAGGIRDIILFKDNTLIMGFVGILIGCLCTNLILNAVLGGGYFKLGMADQPIAHNDVLWNILGMYLVGFGCILLGGCPLRQLVLSGEGNSDSVLTVIGMIAGAAFAHNFGLASSPKGPTSLGKIAVVTGILAVAIIGFMNTPFARKEK